MKEIFYIYDGRYLLDRDRSVCLSVSYDDLESAKKEAKQYGQCFIVDKDGEVVAEVEAYDTTQ
jgi:hypothetical protein